VLHQACSDDQLSQNHLKMRDLSTRINLSDSQQSENAINTQKHAKSYIKFKYDYYTLGSHIKYTKGI
jgi:hypothetical protein